ncbi:alpha-L-rhamnosidase [Verrucomicrobium sp. GAS474]|uniref:family 78 glycoside hydrolase catalytic domain n=1 Tax=Verrucomicrobium sp. GAS474 TaxID=1882831 RepID=UPI00087B8976|nr:family 78 glycoside hydrolase catalytic domain [Verrucomicrobium sp. GAS474]SDT92885.1 alpha-L-rhamnosidase [Verrucomicrobium sp. GAS474]
MNQDSPFPGSRWIWPLSAHWDIVNSYALFRRTFALAAIPARAPLFITADQSYRLFVNGVLVCRGPARGFQGRWPYDEVDLRPYLRKGRNVLAVRAHQPGRSTFQYRTEGTAGLLVAGRWGKLDLASGRNWKAIRQESVSRDTVPCSVQLFNQEHIDLREEAGDWTAVDFDDAAWGVFEDFVWNCGPWFSLEPRDIPPLEEKEIPVGRLIGLGEGISAAGYARVRDVVALRHQEDRSHRPAGTAAMASASLLRVEASAPGRFRSYLIDFGRTVVGSFIYEIAGTQGGEIVDTYYAETIEEATLTPDLVMPTHSRTALGDRLVCRKGDASHTFYHLNGFRYVTITVRDALADFALGLRFRRVGYPLERKGAFASSDPDLERIWETCAWTQQCCSLDAYVDTPWREQAQWWGDARVQAWNTFHLDGDARLFRRGIAQLAGQTTPDGLTYGHAPTIAHTCILPDFTLIWMLTLWDHYWQTGATEAFAAHQETLRRALDYFRSKTDPKSGLITYDDRYWLFLDWTDLFKDGAPAVYNLWLLIALEKMAALYRASRHPVEAVFLEAWAKKLRAALGRLIDRKGLLRDGIDRKGRIVAGTSIHSQTLALMAGLKGVDAARALDTVLLPYLRGETKPKATPSAYWITYLFTLVAERGRGEEIMPFLKRFWLPMADHGTTWENFAPRRGDESFSHAWSAHPLYHLMQTVGGIVQTAPGWKEIAFRPLFHGGHGGAVVPSPRGPIRGEWKKEGTTVTVTLHLPPGVRARVSLPGRKPFLATGKKRWTVPAA